MAEKIKIPPTELVKITEVKTNPGNPRFIRDEKFTKLVNSIKSAPWMLALRPIVVNGDMVVLGGNMRLKACQEAGLKEVPIIKDSDLTADQQREFIIKDNVGFGEWDWEMIANEFEPEELDEWGLDTPDNWDEEKGPQEKEEHGKLTDKFIIPPFSVLDTRQGYWQDRKKYWRELIGGTGESRENTLAPNPEYNIMAQLNNGVSLFDPVLSELVVKWFGLEGSNIVDPFCGDTYKGHVFSALGHKLTGIDIRQEQIDVNNVSKLEGCNYICDDGQNVLKHVKPNSQDILFSCPPYYDLEVYSEDEKDASNQASYDDFMAILENAFTDGFKALKENRFAVIVVGDLRDKNGGYYGFADDVKAIFKKAGAVLYNEMILVETLGTLPQRVGRYMKNRKIGKCHQNILVFYKGNPKKIAEVFPVIDVSIEAVETENPGANEFDVNANNLAPENE